MKISSAVLVEYNANDRGKDAPDCVKRALSMAFSVPYSEIAKELREAQKEYNETHLPRLGWNTYPVYSKVIKKYGGSDRINPETTSQTLEEFADSHSGTYLVETGKTPNRAKHIVCVIDGEVYDSWDSLNQYVVSYYKIEGTHKPKSDIKDRFPELIEYANEVIDKNVELRIKKFKLESDIKYQWTHSTKRGFAFQITKKFGSKEFEDFEGYVQIVYAFSPTTTYDEAIAYIDKITPTRVYDRLYAIRGKIKQLKEAAEYEAEFDLPERAGNIWLSNGREERFYNSLPEWVKRRTTMVDVYYPGQYSDSYTIVFFPLPGDKDRSKVRLEGVTADEIRDKLASYKEDYSRD